MKKLLFTLALAVFVCLPLTVSAAVKVDFKCGKETTDSQNRTVKTCTIALNTTAGESISNFEADLVLTNVTLDEASVKGSGAFTSVVLNNMISFNASTPQTGEKIEIGEFTVVVDTTKSECDITLVPTSANVPNEEIKVDITPENPETGSAISYIAIGAGVLLVAGAYVLSRKNTKMYKI